MRRLRKKKEMNFRSAGATTVLPQASEVPSTYQQLLEHTTAMLQPGVNGSLNRNATLPPPPPGILGWPTGPSLPSAIPQPLDEVNGKS